MRLHLADDAATAAFGARLVAVLKPGDLIALDGDLGAGKTALARAVIRTLVGNPKLDVPSPSFALVQPYEIDGRPILHADLYRLSSEAEIDELGLFDRADAIVLVEWPARVRSLAAKADVTIALSVPKGGAGRDVDIVFRDGREFA